MRALCLSLAYLTLFAAPAFAAEETEEAACMSPVTITQPLVAEATQWNLQGYAGVGALPTFVVGWISPTGVIEDDGSTGAVVFVRNGDGSWRAFAPRSGEGLVGVYGAENGALVFVTMWQTEGPGQTWTILRSSDGLQTGACTEVHFPATLNQPSWANEFLSLRDFDIDARGRGEIIGHAAREQPDDEYYLYRTRDHGQTWSSPRRLRSEREARAGLYTPLFSEESIAPPELVAELTAYAAGR